MADKVTNELIFEQMKRMHGSIRDMDAKIGNMDAKFTAEFSAVNDKLDVMHEHIGVQQMDISALYHRTDYLSGEIDRIKELLAKMPPQNH